MRAWRTELSHIAVVILLAINFSTRPVPNTTSVSDKPGNVVVTGTLVAVEGVECPVMIFLGQYHLVGDLQGFGPGDLVTVTGALDVVTYCQQGTPLRVISIRAA